MYTRVWVLCGMRCNGWSDTRWRRGKKLSGGEGSDYTGCPTAPPPSPPPPPPPPPRSFAVSDLRQRIDFSAERSRPASIAGFEKRRRTIIRDDHSTVGRSVGRSGITRPKVFPSVERRREKGCAPVTRTGGALTGCDKQGVVVVYSSTLYRCSLYP